MINKYFNRNELNKYSKLQIEELIRLFKIHHVYKNMNRSIIHIPFDINAVIINGKHKVFENDDVINDVNYIIKKVHDFNQNLVYDVYGKTILPINAKIYSSTLETVCSIIYLHLRSNEIRRQKITVKQLDWILSYLRERIIISIIEPGEHIGILCASINGQLSTQLNLDTFHFTGMKNESANVARITQLFKCIKNIVDHKMIKTIIHFNPNTSDDKIIKLSKYFIREKMITFISNIQIIDDRNIEKSIIEADQMAIKNWSKINSISTWDLRSVRIIFNRNKLKNHVISIVDIINTLYITFSDITIIKINNYTLRFCIPNLSHNENEISIYIDHIKTIEDLEIQGINNIIDSFIEIEDNNKIVVTVGSNLKEIMSINTDIINYYKTISNHIHDVNQVLGIEAARYIWIKSVYDIYRNNKININSHWVIHLADMVTYMGYFTPLESNDMGKHKTISPYQMMTHERFNQVINLLVSGYTDNLKNPSGAIIYGQLGEHGTNMHEIRTSDIK